MSTSLPKNPGFAQFGLDGRILKAIADLGFEQPTPIQTDALPALLAGENVVGGARTGSGKTAAFGLPLLQRVRTGGPVRALVLAPTRELAIQVSKALTELSSNLPLQVLTIYGGASYQTQLRGLKRGATVVVGTPGRVIDLMDRGALDLKAVEYFVLDEADEMLRMGFVEDVERVLSELPESRQIALFSATMPKQIQRVVSRYLPDATQIQVEDQALSVGHIEQRFVRAMNREKDNALLRLLAGLPTDGTLVFARTRKRCAQVAEVLIQNGINADALHGDLNQGARERVLGRLRSRALDVVVATDVAARGLDVDHLTHVINYDMPDDAENYTHRIGRTARAGRKGMAITLVEPRDRRRRLQFERELKASIPEMQLPTARDIMRVRSDELVDLAAAQLTSPTIVETRNWVRELLAKRGWSAEDFASAVVQLLRPDLTAEFGEEPEAPRVLSEINAVEVVISLGRRDGIRPADIVGTFTNDLGIPASSIGRISLGSHRVFVGLPTDVAKQLLENHDKVSLRGNLAAIARNESHNPSSAAPAAPQTPPNRTKNTKKRTSTKARSKKRARKSGKKK